MHLGGEFLDQVRGLFGSIGQCQHENQVWLNVSHSNSLSKYKGFCWLFWTIGLSWDKLVVMWVARVLVRWAQGKSFKDFQKFTLTQFQQDQKPSVLLLQQSGDRDTVISMPEMWRRDVGLRNRDRERKGGECSWNGHNSVNPLWFSTKNTQNYCRLVMWSK